MATPLESALLLGSLVRDIAKQHEVRVALFVLSHTAEPDASQAFVLAWKPVDSTPWQGLDLQRADRSSFADNVRLTSDTLKAWMREGPSLIDALETRGVFWQHHPAHAGLDFVQAAQTFLIRGLP